MQCAVTFGAGANDLETDFKMLPEARRRTLALGCEFWSLMSMADGSLNRVKAHAEVMRVSSSEKSSTLLRIEAEIQSGLPGDE